MQKSGSLQIYLWLSACPALKNQKSAKGRHFMQNQGALYVPAQADIGASWGLWGLPVPMVVLRGEFFLCSPVGWNTGSLPWRPGFPGHPSYLTAAPPKLWVPWFGFNAVLITQVHFWLSLVTIDIHAYIFYLQSVLFARCFEVSLGPARLVIICPHPHPLARSGAVVGHQLYVLKLLYQINVY